jgi:hypothetical protein
MEFPMNSIKHFTGAAEISYGSISLERAANSKNWDADWFTKSTILHVYMAVNQIFMYAYPIYTASDSSVWETE